jgi:hypothetical protein
MKMQQSCSSETFEGDRASSSGALLLPEFAAARRLARYLTGNSTDVDDVVQNPTLRRLRFLNSDHGRNVRARVQRTVPARELLVERYPLSDRAQPPLKSGSRFTYRSSQIRPQHWSL